MKFRGSTSSKKPRGANARGARTTSWGDVATWYSEHLEGEGTYHAEVIAPNVRRLLAPQKGKPILEIGCGEGYFTRILADEGHVVMGSDISAELIRRARERDPRTSYHVASADNLTFAANGIFSTILAVLTLQNMERIENVCVEVSRVVAPRGRFIGVINHPAFRIPQRSRWGFDAKEGIQYRRMDGYLSASHAEINMHPGSQGKREFTRSYHRSFQDYSKALRVAGFGIIRIEEWISHKESGEGPRKKAEDRARKEFPLFLAFEAMKVAPTGYL